jgi:molecular chaperone GrpE
MTDPTDRDRDNSSQPQDGGAQGGRAGAADGAGDGAGDNSPSSPEDQLAALRAERDEVKDRMLRVAAEFENWKKRARKEQSDAEARARESVLRDMLEIVDNLERATAVKADGDALLKGVNLVLRLFQNKLERHDVRPFEAKGQPFDPKLHEAISQVPTADVPAGSVATELQKGYRIGDRLLRPAMVSVATAPAPATPGAPQG